MMFLVSEVHPFADGSGRIARMMNVHAGELRIVIPTVYRLNHLAALRAATHTSNDAALVAALALARRSTARINFFDRTTAETDLERTYALRDAREAEDARVRLALPGDAAASDRRHASAAGRPRPIGTVRTTTSA